MVKARTLILKGLLEVLVLDALYREPRHGYGLIKDLEEAVGTLPGKNQIYPLLTRLESEGLIESREESGEGGRPRLVYSLTHKGEKRLTEYKALPPPFRDRLLDLWGHGHAGPVDARPGDDAEPGPRIDGGATLPPGEAAPTAQAPAAPAPAPAPAVGPRRATSTTGWVERVLDQVPPGAQIRCPHAGVEMRRERSTGTWTLHATRVELAAHAGHDECALCFVIRAAVRLLFEGGPAGPA